MTHSFSYKDSPYDNACIELFHAILKKEEVNHVQYLDFKSAKRALFHTSKAGIIAKEFKVVLVIKHHKQWKSSPLSLHDFIIYSLHGFTRR